MKASLILILFGGFLTFSNYLQTTLYSHPAMRHFVLKLSLNSYNAPLSWNKVTVLINVRSTIFEPIFAMPSCYCSTHNCCGSNRARNTVAAHREDDRKAQGRLALAAYERSVDREQDEISAYISSITLSEATSINTPSQKLWSSPALVIEESPSSTPLHDTLCQLDDIDDKLEDLKASISSQLDDLPLPSSRGDIFPMLSTEVTLKSLQTRLARVVVTRARTLQTRKDLILSHIGAVSKSLSTAKATWKRQLEQLPKGEEDGHTPIYNTGRCWKLMEINYSLTLLKQSTTFRLSYME